MALLPTRLPNLNKDQFKKDTLRVDFNRDLAEWLKQLAKKGGSGGEPGLTPFIGPNGNWWIGTTDTGVMAEGVPGDSAYVYIAYASDSSGAGFTMTFNPELDYIAILSTTAAIVSPSASDFAGLWKKYKGESGDDGVDGDSAYLYIAYASDDIGTDFSLSPGEGLKYIAALSTTTPISAPNASHFTGLWRKYIGEDGVGALLDIYAADDPYFPIEHLMVQKPGVSPDTRVTTMLKPRGLLWGGMVSWLDDMWFGVSGAIYYIAGAMYKASDNKLELDEADPDNPRIDVIVATADSEFVVVTGTPAANPVKPYVDPISQIEIAEITVPAGATGFGGSIFRETIYNENVEWTGTGVGLTVDFDSTTLPFFGSKCADAGAFGHNDYIKFVNGAPVTVADYDMMFLALKLKAVANATLTATFYLAGKAISSPAMVRFNASSLAWQQLYLILQEVKFKGKQFDEVRFSWLRIGLGTDPGFYLDYVRLERGISVPPQSASIILTGDVTGNGVTGSPVRTTLATVNEDVGEFGGATKVPKITVDAKGRVTAIEEVDVEGSGGDSAYVYIAYASDDAGTDFTLTFDAGLDYIAILSTDTEILTPVVGDFAGLWKNYKGADGIDGTNGITPHIGINGNWYIGIVDTGVPAQGEAGTDAFLYVAYASDNIGTGWSLTPTDLLKYRAEIQSSIALTPIETDFEDAVWVKYIGDDGEDNVDSYEYWSLERQVSKYGLLYNWYAATDERNICAEGWGISTKEAWIELVNLIDPAYGGIFSESANNVLKEPGLTYWNIAGGTNALNFNNRGAGNRAPTTGIFNMLTAFCKFWNLNTHSETHGRITEAISSGIINTGATALKSSGWSIRPIRPATTAEQLLADGTACAPYVGNDGKVYRTVKIGTQVWLADNLCETKFRNGDAIPEVTDNAAWAALTTAGMCAYNNDWDNVMMAGTININSHDLVKIVGNGIDVDITEDGATKTINLTVPPIHEVPAGGTTGQVLTKDSGDDYDTSWQTPSGGSGGSTELVAIPPIDKTASGITTHFTANENQAFGDVVKINSSGKAQLAKADVIANATALAMCVSESVEADATGNYLLIGFVRNDAWNWTIGGDIYLTITGTSGNTLSQTSPFAANPIVEDTIVQLLGVANSADTIYFNPQLVQVELKP